MDIVIQVDQKSGIPIYIQLMDQVKHLIAAGCLRPGEQLPTIRELAVHLAVNLHTVAHAYAELEREGFLSIQRGRGTFICNGQRDETLDDLRAEKLDFLVSTMLADALNLGYEPDDILEALTALIRARERTLAQAAAHKEPEERGTVAHGRRELATTFC
ncbi:MAG TPA: GntR family transcriptional regulator [Anaerolineae bacterium]|nr:GntR family transcriptional regulator [Anaerolineae bacterium]